MRALTQRMLDQAGYDAEANPAIAQLADFAAQRSGIDPRNYFSEWRDRDGRKAYRDEVASISADLKRFREALNVALVEGVTDADVIAEAPHAFSGRLEWVRTTRYEGHPEPCPSCAVRSGQRHLLTCTGGDHLCDGGGHWSYCTGQYFPTEYRAAAATLLEYAIRRVRQARPPESRERITSIGELQALNERNGGCWFSRSTMRFHGTKIVSGIIRGEFFITLDKRGFDESAGYGYNVRRFNDKGDVWSAHIDGHDVTKPFSEKGDALKAIQRLVQAEATEQAA